MTAIRTLVAIVILATASIGQAAITPTDADLARWGSNWDRLIPEGAYDFFPDNFTFDLMFDPTFQSKLDEANLKLNATIEGVTLDLAGFMVPLETANGLVQYFLLVPKLNNVTQNYLYLLALKYDVTILLRISAPFTSIPLLVTPSAKFRS